MHIGVPVKKVTTHTLIIFYDCHVDLKFKQSCDCVMNPLYVQLVMEVPFLFVRHMENFYQRGSFLLCHDIGKTL